MSQYIYSNAYSDGHRNYIKYDITETNTSWSITYAVGIEATNKAIDHPPKGESGFAIPWDSLLLENRTDGTGWSNERSNTQMTCALGNRKRILGEYTRTASKGHSGKTFGIEWKSGAPATYAAEHTWNVPAKASYTIKYNANGGLSAPAAMTKWHGENLTLATTKPTRAGYTFKGWSTAADGAVVYKAGSTYTANAAATLYAVWEMNITAPQITNLIAFRAALIDGEYKEDDNGTTPKIAFNWAKALQGTVPIEPTEITIGIKRTADEQYRITQLSDTQITDGYISVALTNETLSTDYAYDIQVSIVTEGFKTATKNTFISEPRLIIDINPNGTAIGFGRSVNDDDYGIFSNLPIYINDKEVVPYEEGTAVAGSVTWEYKKYADGELEMWGSATTTLAVATASGAIYTTANEYDIAVPAFVDTIDFASGELSGGGWVDVTSFATPPKMRLYAPTSYSSASRVLKYYIRGTWK